MDYADSLTEKEWLKAIDEDGDYDDEEEEEEKLKQKRRGRKRRKREESDEDEPPQRRKRKTTSMASEAKLKRKMKKLMSVVINYNDRFVGKLTLKASATFLRFAETSDSSATSSCACPTAKSIQSTTQSSKNPSTSTRS